MYLKLKRCRTVHPLSGDEEVVDIGVRDGVVDTVGAVRDARADKVVDAKEDYVVPALVDLHTHVYHLGTSLGVNADEVAKHSGVGVFVDAGSAGAGNFAGFREYVIRRSNSRIYSFLNIGFGGIPFFGIQKDSQAGEIPDLRVADAEACGNCVRANREHIVGIKVRLSKMANGALGVQPLVVAKRCAKSLGLPVMAHFGKPPPSVREVVNLLEKGDVLTHTFRPEPNSILGEPGTGVLEELKEAKKRGVVIDVGHGMGGISFDVAKAALADGFEPDTISTDIHSLSLPSPVHDLETTMSKFLNLGMQMSKVIKAVTYTPAKAIGKLEHGTVSPSAAANLVMLRVSKSKVVMKDATGKRMTFGKVIRPVLRVTGKEIRKM